LSARNRLKESFQNEGFVECIQNDLFPFVIPWKGNFPKQRLPFFSSFAAAAATTARSFSDSATTGHAPPLPCAPHPPPFPVAVAAAVAAGIDQIGRHNGEMYFQSIHIDLLDFFYLFWC
jgi:hypothetical protein